MSTNAVAVVDGSNIPAHIAARINQRQGASSAALDAVITGTTFPRVSIRASRYRLVDDAEEKVVGTEMDVVVVAVNPAVSKVWYDKAYTGDSDAPVLPACFSNDGKTPDPSVKSPVSTSCVNCPKNVLGSRITPNGAQSKECNDVRHMAVLPAADPSKPYALTVPVSGMKALRQYFKGLAGYNLIPEEVITTLGFDDQASFPKITFKHKGYVNEKHIKSIEEMAQTPEVKVMTRQVAVPVVQPTLPAPEAAPAPAPAPVAAAPAPAPAPKDEPVRAAKDPGDYLSDKKKQELADEEAAKAKRVRAAAKPAEPAPAPAAQPTDHEAALSAQLDDLFK